MGVQQYVELVGGGGGRGEGVHESMIYYMYIAGILLTTGRYSRSLVIGTHMVNSEYKFIRSK